MHHWVVGLLTKKKELGLGLELGLDLGLGKRVRAISCVRVVLFRGWCYYGKTPTTNYYTGHYLTVKMFTHKAAISILKAALKMNGREAHRAALSPSI